MRVFICLLASILFGCASKPPLLQKTDFIPTHWPKQQKQLTQLNTWHLQAQVGIQTPHQSGSLQILWEQHQDSFLIRSFNAFGQPNALLKGKKEGTLLYSPSTGQKSGDTQRLLTETLGTHIPFHSLLFWIRGIPDPATPYQLTFYAHGELAKIKQAGWEIHYDAFLKVNGYSLPQRIRVEKEPARVKMYISTWLP